MTIANLASNLVETASGLGDSVALRVGPTAMTYAELDRASSRVAGMLRERGHVMAQVAAYKYPRKVWIVNELPKARPERSSNVRSFLRATRAREKSEVYGLLLDGDNR